jgi:hypothetical protein
VDSLTGAMKSWPTARASDAENFSQSRISRAEDGTMDQGKLQLREAVQKNWPTATSSDAKGHYSPEAMIRKDGKDRSMDRLDQAVVTVAQWPTPTAAEGSKIPSQANYGQQGLSNHPAIVGEPTRAKGKKDRKGDGRRSTDSGPPVQENLSTNGSRPESWATPTALLGSMYAEKNAEERHSPSLASQAAWATPQAQDAHNINQSKSDYQTRPNDMLKTAGSGKLNPSWVETLMGYPIGHTQLPTVFRASRRSATPSSRKSQ